MMAFDTISLTLVTLSLLSGFRTKHKLLSLPGGNSRGNYWVIWELKDFLCYSFTRMLVCVTSQT